MKKLTQQEVEQRIKNLVGDEYTLLEEYKVPLLRIPYTNKNIEGTLSTFIASMGGDANV